MAAWADEMRLREKAVRSFRVTPLLAAMVRQYQQLYLTRMQPLPSPILCPVPNCADIGIWKIYSGSDPLFMGAHIANVRVPCRLSSFLAR